MKNKSFLLRLFFALTFIESAFVLYLLASIPADTKSALLFGFSASRLALMGGVCAVLICALFFLIVQTERAVNFADEFLSNAKKRRALIAICAVIALAGILFALTPAERIGEAIYQRVLPVMALSAIIAAQILAGQFIWRGEKIYWSQIKHWNPIFISAGVALAFFIAAWIYIAWSGVGIEPQKSGWLTPGTPLLAQQVLFAFALSLVFIVFGKRLEQSKKADIIIALILWLAAGVIWQMEPMRLWSYFTPKPTPPNFEYYPYSDAILHDQFAQHVLIGAGRQFGLTVRPLYAFCLALLHALLGQKFETIVVAQVFILAITPALIYLLALKLGGRAAAILAALLVIFREKNSIALSNVIEVSHSKLLMSDLPTMTMLALFMIFLTYWLQDQKNRSSLGALAGAALGLAMLIRSQAQVAIPIALLGIIVAKKEHWKIILQKALIFLLGVTVVVAPWIWRNYQLSGRAVIEYQEVYTLFFASSYSSSPQETAMLPNETVKEYDKRMMALIVNAALSNPQKVVGELSSYFIHNEVLSIAYLPMSLQFKELYAYVNETRFWSAPKEQLPVRVLPIFFIALCFISIGLGTAFRRAGWTGVMPLLFHFGYSFTVAPIHASGWRFILPVDWVSLFYFSIGLTQVSAITLSLFSKQEKEETRETISTQPINWNKTATVFAVFALIGLSLPISEWSVPARYPAMDSSALIQKYAPDGFTVNGETVSASNMENFLTAEPNAIILDGGAMYPAYYEQGAFWGDAVFLTEAKLYNRLQFNLMGGRREYVFLPLETAPKYFPHAATVFIVGCKTPNAIQALAIKVNDVFVTTSPWRGLTCATQ